MTSSRWLAAKPQEYHKKSTGLAVGETRCPYKDFKVRGSFPIYKVLGIEFYPTQIPRRKAKVPEGCCIQRDTYAM